MKHIHENPVPLNHQGNKHSRSYRDESMRTFCSFGIQRFLCTLTHAHPDMLKTTQTHLCARTHLPEGQKAVRGGGGDILISLSTL